MIHIVFEEANIEALKKSFELDETMQGEIVSIQDDYAVGPINRYCITPMAAENRRLWWKQILEGGQYEGIADDGHVHDNEDVAIT